MHPQAFAIASPLSNSTTNITFLFTNNHWLYQQFVKKFVS